MMRINEIPAFIDDYEKLRNISLDPNRHEAASAHSHTEMVVARIKALLQENAVTPEEERLLIDCAYVHDIGKIVGSPHPVHSVAMMRSYGIEDERIINLVKYHDVALSWHRSDKDGNPPRDKSWNKLKAAVDVFHLCLFMIADRIDAPGGWMNNAPTLWFFRELAKRGWMRPMIVDGEKFNFTAVWMDLIL